MALEGVVPELQRHLAVQQGAQAGLLQSSSPTSPHLAIPQESFAQGGRQSRVRGWTSVVLSER